MVSKKIKQKICAAAIASVMGVFTMMSGVAVVRANSAVETVDANNIMNTSSANRTISTGIIGSGTSGSGAIGTGNNAQTDTLTTNATSSASDTVNMWVPKTAEEKKLFSYVGKEKIQAQTIGGSITVNMTNSVQGIKCHEASQSALNGYSLARTYNIFPNNSNLKKPVYETEEKVTLSMVIPSGLQKEGRQFKMICVGKDGAVYELFDIDTNPATITFETNHFYAYALCYVD